MTTTVRDDTKARQRYEKTAREVREVFGVPNTPPGPVSVVDDFRARAVELMRAEAEDARAAGDYFGANAIERVAALVHALPVLPADAPAAVRARAARADAVALQPRPSIGSGSVVAERKRA